MPKPRTNGLGFGWRVHNLAGRVFGRWTVAEYSRSLGRHSYWWCRCACGNTDEIRGSHLVRYERLGRMQSCGCWRADSDVRRAARLAMPAERRIEIAHMGGAAYAAAKKN